MQPQLTAGASGPIVLGTKLHVPAARTKSVERLALLERLTLDSLPGLILVAAPPGWGKTTLLAAWCGSAGKQRSFAWLSLDRADNDPVRFWTYAIEALRTITTGVGEQALSLLRAPGAGVADAVLPALINDLEQQRRLLVLVLDDYHLVTNREIHDAMAFLVEHLPVRLRLVVATRADPPLPLPRLRARGELLEIRSDELRFSREEATAFLNDVLVLGLTAEDVDLLYQRTEGWAAGLYLAALSLGGRTNTHAFIEQFAGDDRHVVDYLVTEVLDRQPDELRTFLLRTSILERLSGALCDSVLDRDGSADTLEEFERSNLFLVPLDTRRQWYRYHHLFADLLRHELEQTEPELVPELHRRASAWLREHGSISEAVAHALAARDLAAATDLIALHWNDYLNQGRLRTVADWLAELPETVVGADPRLCLAKAGVSLTLGRRDEVDPWLDAAEERPVADDRPRFGASTVQAEAAIYRAVHRYMICDFGTAAEAGRRAVELERDERSPWRAMALGALGRALFWVGELRESEELLHQAAERSQPKSNNLSVIAALGYLATILVGRGEDEDAEALVRRALAMVDEHGFREHWVSAMPLVARSKILGRERKLAEAEEAAGRAVGLTRRGNVRAELTYSLLALADVRHMQGDRAGTRDALREARQLIDRSVEPGVLGDMVTGQERLLDRRSARNAREFGDELTRQELAVLRLLPSQRSLREIGAALYVSHNTVKTHVRGIYRKLQASTRREAVARARDLGLV